MHARRRLRTLSGHVLATAGTASLGAAAPSDAEASGGPAPAAGAPLSPQQVEHYRTFGFVNLPGCLLPELPALEREHAAALAGSFGDEQPSSRQTVRMLRDDFPTFNALPESCGNLAGGLGAVAEQLYGPDMCAIHRVHRCASRGTADSRADWNVPRRFCAYVEANRYVGDTSWHPDYSMHYNAPGCRFAFYLDHLGESSGALRIIPGSHASPLHETLYDAHQRRGSPGASHHSYLRIIRPLVED